MGTSCDTAAFAVNALRLWWQREGALRYPGATRLLVTADAGGSNGYPVPAVEGPARRPGRRDRAEDQHRALPARHQQVEPDRAPAVLPHHPHLADPPADDRGQRRGQASPPLSPSQGLKCTAVRDDAAYPEGAQVSGERLRYLQDRVVVRPRPAPRLELHHLARSPARPRTRTRSPNPGPGPGPGGPGPIPPIVRALAALAGIGDPDAGSAGELALAWDAARASAASPAPAVRGLRPPLRQQHRRAWPG